MIDRTLTRGRLFCCVLTLACSSATSLRAEVVGVEVVSRVAFADGHLFGRSGAYEKLTGRLRIEVDPDDPANHRVTDLKLAPRNERGKVAFATDFCLLKPVDAARGNRRLFYDVNNRGNKLALGAFNDARGNDPTTLADAGNGFLMRQGYSILWCGWNGDVLPGGGRMLIDLPVATDNSRPITGRVYAEIVVSSRSYSEPFYWGNSNAYSAVDLDNSRATLTVRPNRNEPAVELPRDQWAFARYEKGDVVADAKHLYIKDGFVPGHLYELTYTARDPRVTGLGFAAVRDAVSFFRFGGGTESSPAAANPLAGAIERAYIFGISQSGRFIHHFLYEGFNTDEAGRMVFDAAFPHVAGGGKGQFNYRFAQTTRHGSQHEDNLYPSDFFPFNTVQQHDPLTGREGDTFARSRQQGHMPKIFFSMTSTEYWSRAASLLHTDVEGKQDAELDPNVRLYFIAGAQHGVSSSSSRGIYQHETNTLDHRPVLRALLVALDGWVTNGAEPPASAYPKIADGTLVDLETWRKSFPRIPGMELPATLFRPLRLDPGPRWETEGIADHVPPKAGAPYVTLVPAVDADGNELAGIRLPEVAVPLRTLAGWNLRGEEAGAAGMLSRWAGSQWAFPQSPQDREKSADPRRSIAERYPAHADYVARVARSAIELRAQRFLLDEDVLRVLETAGGDVDGVRE